MPLLGLMLVNLITGFAAWLATYFTQKIAVATAMSIVLGILIAGVYAAARSALQLATGAAAEIHPNFGAGIGMIISPSTASLLTSYIGFFVTIELYKWKVNLMQLWARTI